MATIKIGRGTQTSFNGLTKSDDEIYFVDSSTASGASAATCDSLYLGSSLVATSKIDLLRSSSTKGAIFYSNGSGNQLAILAKPIDTTNKFLTINSSGELDWSTVTLPNSGATAGTYGESANKTLTYAGTFTVPKVTVDAQGLVTSASNITLTMPLAKNVVSSTSTGTSNDSTVTNGNVHLNFVSKTADGGTVESSTQFIGDSNSMQVTAASGVVSIACVWNDL